MTIKNIYKVLVIGAGNMGAFFDAPGSKYIFTHAHAFTNHPGFHLIGFVDIDNKKGRKAISLWGGKNYNNIDAAFKDNQKIDIVVVSVPDSFHYEILSKISFYPVKLIFAEKPLVNNIDQLNKLKKIYQKKKNIIVNYTRRFIPEYIEIKKNIQKNKYGKFITGSSYYGKGFLNGGSHVIDLIRFFIGEIKNFKITDNGNLFSKNDPSISVLLNLKNGSIFYLHCIDKLPYKIFEIDLFFEKSRIIIKNGGFIIEEYEVQNNKMFKGRKNLKLKKTIRTHSETSMLFAANEIYNIFENKTEMIKSEFNSGYQTTKTCLDIINSLSKGDE